MKIVEIRDLKDCFDSSIMKEVLFDDIITEEIIYYFGQTGELQYFPSFSKPFYKVDSAGKYILKGVEGNKTARVILSRKNIDEALKYFEDYVKRFGKERQR